MFERKGSSTSVAHNDIFQDSAHGSCAALMFVYTSMLYDKIHGACVPRLLQLNQGDHQMIGLKRSHALYLHTSTVVTQTCAGDINRISSC
jgi:hypothetical protein